MVRVEAEVGSGMNGSRAKVRRLLADPAVTAVVVEHRDRLGRMNTELVEAALSAHGRRLVVLDDGEVTDDLVRDMMEVLTSFCARLYGRRSARNRALKAVGCAQRDIGPRAVLKAGSGPAVPGERAAARSPGRSWRAAPAGARVRTRLRVSGAGRGGAAGGGHAPGVAGAGVTWRRGARKGGWTRRAGRVSRAARKRALTAESSSRWAGAITRTSEDAWQLAGRNLRAERGSLKARVRQIEARLAVPAGGKAGRVRGYATPAERHAKTLRLKALKARLARGGAAAGGGAVPVTRGGKAAAAQAAQPRRRRADRGPVAGAMGVGPAVPHRRRGEGQGLGQRDDPLAPRRGLAGDQAPRPAGAPGEPAPRPLPAVLPGRFAYRGDEVAAQAATGAVRYDISLDPDGAAGTSTRRGRRRPPRPCRWRSCGGTVVAVDVNAGHLAAWRSTPDGNVAGTPVHDPPGPGRAARRAPATGGSAPPSARLIAGPRAAGAGRS